MKSLFFFAVSLAFATPIFAAEDKPSFEISTRYEGFDPALFTELHRDDPSAPPDAGAGAAPGVQSAPQVTTRAGQSATIEIIQQHLVPTGGDPKHVNAGVTLAVTPEFKDGKVTLFGESVVRHQVDPGGDQPLHAQSFTTRETFFNGEVAEGQDYTIRVGDNPKDPAKITVTVKRAVLPDHVSHAGLPRFHLYTLQPSPEEAKRPIYRQLSLGPDPAPSTPFVVESLRKSGLAVWGVFDPAQVARAGQEGLSLPAPAALRLVPDADAPLKVTGIVGADGTTVDVQLEPTGKLAGLTSTSVSIWWGSEIYLAVADGTQPSGRRILIVKQD